MMTIHARSFSRVRAQMRSAIHITGSTLALVMVACPPVLAQHEKEPVEATAPKPAAEYAFEWGGVYPLVAGAADLVIQPGPDASIDIALVPVADNSAAAFDAAAAAAVQIFAGQAKAVQPGEELVPGSQFYQLRVEGTAEMRFVVRVATSGRFALFTQHFADEFQTTFVAGGQKVYPLSMRNFHERFGQIVIQPSAMEAFGITLEPAGLHTLVPAFTAPARVAFNAERLAHIGSAVVGRVAALPVRQGDAVATGDTLLVVDSPELGQAQSDYLQKRTLAETAAPIVDLARSSFERAKSLYDKSQGVSLTEVQRRQAEHQTAESTLLNARAALLGALNRLQLFGMNAAEIKVLGDTGTLTPHYTVRSPMNGRVIRRDVTLGQLVSPDRDDLLAVADLTTLWVLVDVPELQLRDVAVGSPARVTLAALPGATFDGGVSFISADLNEATRTAQVRIEVDNPDGRLRPGMFAQAEILQKAPVVPGTPNLGVLAVPESSVQSIEGKPVVFVPLNDKPNTYLKRPVTVGTAVGGMVPVIYGLREGESIVLTGTFLLKAELGKSSAKHEH
jgi:membrane fusion protein, heavy metal efflux system